MTVTRTDWRTKVHQLARCRGTLRVWVETNSGAELLADGEDAGDLLDALEAVDYFGVPEPPGEDDEDGEPENCFGRNSYQGLGARIRGAEAGKARYRNV